MVNYYEKYTKYINKLNQLGGSIDFCTCFLWINNKLDNISDNIKNKITRVISLWKNDNPMKNIYLFIDYTLTTSNDKIFFEQNTNIILKNILDLHVIKSSQELQRLLNSDIPIYMRVDNAKILIQYEILTNYNEYNVNYVVASDIDLLMDTDMPTRKLNCIHNTLPDFKEEHIFDIDTMELLNLFGLVMGRHGDTVPENNFMIAKRDKKLIEAMEDIFINKIMKDILFNIFVNGIDKISYEPVNDLSQMITRYHLCAQFVYNCYHWFFGYLGFLKQYYYFRTQLNITNDDILSKIPLENIKQFNDKKIVIIDSKYLFWVLNDNLGFQHGNNFFNFNFNKGIVFSHLNTFYTSLGLDIYNKNHRTIYPYYETEIGSKHVGSYMIPSKCVKIETSLTTHIDTMEKLC